MSGCTFGAGNSGSDGSAFSMSALLFASAPQLAEDWAGWAEAWVRLDAGAIARLLQADEAGEAVSLTLCGERFAQRFDSAPRTLWQRLRGTWQRAAVTPVLVAL